MVKRIKCHVLIFWFQVQVQVSFRSYQLLQIYTFCFSRASKQLFYQAAATETILPQVSALHTVQDAAGSVQPEINTYPSVRGI